MKIVFSLVIINRPSLLTNTHLIVSVFVLKRTYAMHVDNCALRVLLSNK